MLKNTLKLTAVILTIALLSTVASLFAIAEETTAEIDSLYKEFREKTIFISTKEKVDYQDTYDGETFDFLGLKVNNIRVLEISDETYGIHYYSYRLTFNNGYSENDVQYLRSHPDVLYGVVSLVNDERELMFFDNLLQITFLDKTTLSEAASYLEKLGIIVKTLEVSGDKSFNLTFDDEEEMVDAFKTLLWDDSLYICDRSIFRRKIGIGDLDGDHEITIFDCAIVKRIALSTYMSSMSAYKRADINGDGTVNAYDYALLKRHYLGTNTLDYVNIQRPE